jgi:hypothetical protein
MYNLGTVEIGASCTHVKRSKVKVLQNTEALFEKLCYLTKVSLKAGGGTEILIDVSDLGNCIGVSGRTIRSHLKILCEFGVISRLDGVCHVYRLHDLVLADIVQKKRHKFLKVYLNNADLNKAVDNALVFPFVLEEISTPHIYRTKDKSNKSLENFLRKAEEGKCLKTTTARDMGRVMSEVFEKDWKLDKRLCRLLVAAMKLKFRTLERFRDYCEVVKKSWIWFSERIKSKVHYILKFGVIDKFLPRECYVSGVSDAVEADASAFAEEHLSNVEESERCKDVRRRILRGHGALQYKTWLTQVTLAENGGEVVLDRVPNNFVRDYVHQHFMILLQEKRGV